MFSYSKDGITVSSMLDPRKLNSRNEYPIKIRVNYKRQREYYSTGRSISKDEWEKLPQSKTTSAKKLKEEIESSFSLVRKNVEYMVERGEFSFDLLNLRLGRGTGDTVNTAIRAKIEELKSDGRISTMKLFVNTLLLIERFGGANIQFSSITVNWLKLCEQEWLKTKKYSTIGMHFRNLRIVMNDARRAGVVKESQYPFGRGKFEIKTGEAHKKALTKNQIKAIFEYNTTNEATMKYKDLWIMCYLCNGINIADLIKLRFSDIINGEICFVRQKTARTTKSRKEIRIIVTDEIQRIIDRWGNAPSKDNYLFSFLKGKESPIERKSILEDVIVRINKRMKLIGEELGIGKITTYTARHSYATILKRSGANIAYISESLGHTDLKTTESYLASFEREERIKNAALLTQFSL
ncbi:site-specific integrase [uncultured Acetobacteroides sp.]|uniref:site-specific integrase n=1 Tax=uncultured Acetobacteroides sp. TaxID=1760811 RepID=UPI0029F50348|nr:site-specific integrase [uncultured Acetobacteroides sp.]